ncbi:MAG TPA: hypothetical protein VGS79_03460 [Puia sp.]|nr:hypothetical protein [Puia sp.]
MQIVHIFGSKIGPQEGDGLWAVRYDPAGGHAFREFFDCLEDPEWVFDFCQKNLADLQSKFGRPVSAEDGALELMEESQAPKKR